MSPQDWKSAKRTILCCAALVCLLGACQKSAEPPDPGPTDGQGATCGNSSAESLIACVDSNLYHQDLERITGFRPPGSVHWQEVRDLCAERLSALGFTVERQAYGTGVNVIGTLPGSDLASERVVVSAHYDHLADCAGADDNASGVAGALEVARVLSKGRYRRTAVIACWDQEEGDSGGPTAGSRAYVVRARQRNETVTASFVMDMIGYKSSVPGSQRMPAGLERQFPEPMAQITGNLNRGDFLALIADPLSHAAASRLEVRARPLGLKVVNFELSEAQMTAPELRDLHRSDHSSFWSSGYPALFLGDTANFRNPHYHCEEGPDTVADLDDGFSMQIIGALLGAAVDALELQ